MYTMFMYIVAQGTHGRYMYVYIQNVHVHLVELHVHVYMYMYIYKYTDFTVSGLWYELGTEDVGLVGGVE